ncbi:MAG TPA: exopolysaccharide biosynthesis protein [Caulobacteraceae bacterium]|nr:exopolysaccharide biosynthesis protein [Caulobacteraceae bacterium]
MTGYTQGARRLARARPANRPRSSDPAHSDSVVARLRPLGEGDGDIALGDMIGPMEGDEGPGPVLLVLTLPVLLPLPPGVSMVMALPILLAAPQVLAGRRRLWLPKWLARRRLKRRDLARLVDRLGPSLQRVEGVVRPRLGFLTGRAGEMLAGLACTLIGIILVLPIPFANLLPSWSLAAFSLGLTRRDGVFVLAGYGLLTAALAVIALAAFGVDLGVTRLRGVF